MPGSLIERRASSQCPRPRAHPVWVRTGIRAQSNSRGPRAPAPAEIRCQARDGTAAISASVRRSPSGMVSVSLHRMAITYQMSWSSSQACSHLACP